MIDIEHAKLLTESKVRKKLILQKISVLSKKERKKLGKGKIKFMALCGGK